MSEAYKVLKVIELPNSCLDSNYHFHDYLVFTEEKIFYFTNTRFNKFGVEDGNYSVKVWKSKSRSQRRYNGKLLYNTMIMEIGRTFTWNRSKIARAGTGSGRQPVREVSEEELPAIKERVVEHLI